MFFGENVTRVLMALSGLLFLAGFGPYIYEVWRDRAKVEGKKPVKATWIIWAALDTITLVGMATEDKLNGQIVGAVLGAWAVVVLALKYGLPGWAKLDKFCLGGAVLGLGLWYLFNSPTIGVATSVSVVFLGSLPTFVSAWRNPEKESRLAWGIYWISCIPAVLAIPHCTFVDAMQPVTFFVIESIMVYILFAEPLFDRVGAPIEN